MPTPLPTLHDWRLSVDYEGIAWALMDRGRRAGELDGGAGSPGARRDHQIGEHAAIHGEIKGLGADERQADEKPGRLGAHQHETLDLAVDGGGLSRI